MEGQKEKIAGHLNVEGRHFELEEWKEEWIPMVVAVQQGERLA